jgi:hypothetical protein
MVNKVTTGQVFLRAIWFSPANIIPPTHQNHLQLHVALTSMTKGRSLENFQKTKLYAFGISGNIG